MYRERHRFSFVIFAGLAALVIALAAPLGQARADARSDSDRPEHDSSQSQKETKKKKRKRSGKKKGAPMPALKFKMKDIDGEEKNLADYYGNVILMVNTASRCGFTPQYEGLEKLYQKYRDRGFTILAFPANNFGAQEPGSNEQIKAFCSSKFNVTFPLFAKVSVKGEDICPLYQYLTAKDAGHRFGGEIPWNFNKFLIDRKGRVVGRFAPGVAPDDKKLTRAIERRLKKPIPEDSPAARRQRDKETKTD